MSKDLSGLTPRQVKILTAIQEGIQNNGYPPSVREIGVAAGLNSSASVQYQLKALEEAGFIRRDGSLGRALEGVALELAPVALDAGIDGPDAANALAVVAKGSPRAQLRFHMDVISAFAEAGGAPRSVEEHLSLAANTAARHAGAYPEASFFLASGRVAHEAGGSAAQELAFAASSVVAHAKAAGDLWNSSDRGTRPLLLHE